MKHRKNKNAEEVENNGIKEGSDINEVNEAAEDGQDSTATNEQQADELAVMKQKYEEVNDKYLRLYSDFDNFRKRALKERIELSKTASEEVLVDFLTILDDFERAISSFETVKTVEPLKEGTMLIYNKFRNNLSQKGLTEIEALGKTFDTDYHEAIANVPATSDEQKNMVIDVTQKGYMLNGKVVRFAKVVVSK